MVYKVLSQLAERKLVRETIFLLEPPADGYFDNLSAFLPTVAVVDPTTGQHLPFTRAGRLFAASGNNSRKR